MTEKRVKAYSRWTYIANHDMSPGVRRSGSAAAWVPAMRFFRIAIGYLAAAYCASLLFLVLLVLRDPDSNNAIRLLPYFAAYGMLFVVPITLLQSALLVFICEFYHIRSIKFYLLAGFITGATALAVLTPGTLLQATRYSLYLDLLLGLEGAVCACVYWAIAGRNARPAHDPRTSDKLPALHIRGNRALRRSYRLRDVQAARRFIQPPLRRVA